jgi:hypothetical protein
LSLIVDDDLGVMDPSVVEASPRRLGIVLDYTVFVHDVENMLDAFKVGATLAKLVGVFDLEVLESLSFFNGFEVLQHLDPQHRCFDQT